MSDMPVPLLCCYAPEDDEHRATLERHLAQLQRQRLIKLCTVMPGDSLQSEAQLAQAGLIIFLVTSHFLSSDRCLDLLHRATQAQLVRSIRLVPVLVSPCDWSESELGPLQSWPRNNQAVTSWPNQEAAWLDVAQGIRSIVTAETKPDLRESADRENGVAAWWRFRGRRPQLGVALLILVASGVAIAIREEPPANMVRVPLGYLRWDGRSQATRHWIWPFALDRDEVTQGSLLGWLEARTGVQEKDGRFNDTDGVLLAVREGVHSTHADLRPASGVTHEGATRYCAALGRRLPSYEEWSLAARSTPAFDQGALTCAEVTCARNGGECGTGGTVAVGTALHDRSAEGVHDLAGSVSEWVQEKGGQRFARGGSFARPATSCSSGFVVLLQPGTEYADVGFRCARDLRW